MEKVGLLYLKTGGGHYSAARALEQQMSMNDSHKVEPVLIDPISDNQVLKAVLEDGYGRLCSDLQYMWPAFYNIQKSEKAVFHIHRLMQIILTDIIVDQIVKHNLERIVVLHFLLVGPVKAALEKTGVEIPCVTVILDPFTAPPLWYLGNDFPMYCFSEEVAREVMDNKSADTAVVYKHPIIVDRKFNHKPDETRYQQILSENGFNHSKKRVLIMSGGEGGGRKSLSLLQHLLKRNREYEILFICGKSDKVYKKALKMAERKGKKGVFLFTFVSNINELMSVSDVVVTKAGPASIMESLFMETPLILNDYMYGQEQGNVDFVVNNGLGSYETDPEQIGEIIMQYMDPVYIRGFRDRLVELDLKSGTESITSAILKEQRVS